MGGVNQGHVEFYKCTAGLISCSVPAGEIVGKSPLMHHPRAAGMEGETPGFSESCPGVAFNRLEAALPATLTGECRFNHAGITYVCGPDSIFWSHRHVSCFRGRWTYSRKRHCLIERTWSLHDLQSNQYSNQC